MFLKVLFFCLFSIFAYANSLIIDSVDKNYFLNDFNMYEDKEKNADIDFILNNKNLFKIQSKTNLGIKKHPIWTIAKIINKTDKDTQYIFTNPRAGIDFIDVYIYSDGRLLHKFILGDMTSQKNREFVYRKSTYLLELEPHKEYEIITRYKSFGAIDINWSLHLENDYISYISKESLIFGFIAGFVFIISTYILFIDKILSSTAHKIYFFLIISALVTQFSVAGIFYQLGINPYINTIFSWTIGNLGAAAIGFFPIYFFNLKKILPKSTVILYILSFLLVIFSVIFLFYPLKNDLLYLSSITNQILFLLILFLMYVSIRLSIKKIQGHLLYLFGNTIFTVCCIYFLLGLLGLVKVDELFYYSLGFGSVSNIIFMAFVIIQKLMYIKKERENALLVVNQYTKLSSVGQAMINISHQWKEPINHIYYAVNNIEAAKEFNDSNLSNIIDKSIQDIKETTTYMSNTGKNFLSVYQDDSITENTKIITCIKFAKTILENELKKLNIDLIYDETCDYKIYADKYLLSNVFMVIIENAIKIFKKNIISKPIINMQISKYESKLEIKISDNAGGINITPIDSIFDKDLTQSNSTGIGLFIAKSILNMKLNGDMSVENIKNGACFTIILNTH